MAYRTHNFTCSVNFLPLTSIFYMLLKCEEMEQLQVNSLFFFKEKVCCAKKWPSPGRLRACILSFCREGEGHCNLRSMVDWGEGVWGLHDTNTLQFHKCSTVWWGPLSAILHVVLWNIVYSNIYIWRNICKINDDNILYISNYRSISRSLIILDLSSKWIQI